MLLLNKVKGIALDFFFPHWCVGCGKEGDFICSSCRSSLPRITPPLCPKCGQPQASSTPCLNCASWQAENGSFLPLEGSNKRMALSFKVGDVVF